ncbi:hypothetical protein NPS01_26760 [Nocardioides psychrotolerans]|nr:hypothetical protein NPS01_26760 [Nocardioides psychrotolerans]
MDIVLLELGPQEVVGPEVCQEMTIGRPQAADEVVHHRGSAGSGGPPLGRTGRVHEVSMPRVLAARRVGCTHEHRGGV